MLADKTNPPNHRVAEDQEAHVTRTRARDTAVTLARIDKPVYAKEGHESTRDSQKGS